MYLSRLSLDIKDRNTIKIINNPRKIHGIVEACFNDANDRNLWRLDYSSNYTYIYIMSPHEPNFSNAKEQLNLNKENAIITKNMDKLFDSFKQGQYWHFRLRANPVKAVKQEAGRGKRTALASIESQKQWFLDRKDQWGFEINNKEIENPETNETTLLYDFNILEKSWISFEKYANVGKKHNVKILTVTYEGNLFITDVELFKENLKLGFGKGKAYGCGLMTLAFPHI